MLTSSTECKKCFFCIKSQKTWKLLIKIQIVLSSKGYAYSNNNHLFVELNITIPDAINIIPLVSNWFHMLYILIGGQEL